MQLELYFIGLFLSFIAYGIWFGLEEEPSYSFQVKESEAYLPLVFIGAIMWPITLLLGTSFFLGVLLSSQIKKMYSRWFKNET